MKSKLLIVSTVLAFLLLISYTYASRQTIVATTPMPENVPMCAPPSAELTQIPAFVQTPTYLLEAKTAPMRVRRNVTDLAPTDSTVIALKKGISVMRSRDISDPTSWEYQAAIHGTALKQLQPSWNSCTHGNDFFLSWHRMYLYFFERILRKSSGDPNFALPYWDWSQPNGAALPLTFRQPNSSKKMRFTSLPATLLSIKAHCYRQQSSKRTCKM